MERSLQRQGHEVIVWGLGHSGFENNALVMLLDGVGVILVLEQYTSEWIPDLSDLNIPVVYWSIDSHCNFESDKRFVKKLRANAVLCSCKPDIERFQKETIARVEWFPYAYPSDLIKPDVLIKTRDIGFCGSKGNPARQEYLKNLQRDIGLSFVDGLLGFEMVNFIQRCRIHFNINLSHDINYRTFETMGAGTMLLTNETPGLEELFKIEKHLITYTGYEDCVDKIKYYIQNQDELEKIAIAGYAHVRKNHTYDNRAEQFIAFCRKWYSLK